jgi:Na+/H+ antiporter NhaC
MPTRCCWAARCGRWQTVGISREKLAYLVDSTAAPVAGLALVSTWVAGEIGFIRAGFAGLGDGVAEADAFRIFVATIPYRFYVLWALMLVPLVALLGRDFGPMWQAEQRAADAEAKPAAVPFGATRPVVRRPSGARWHNAVLPVLVVIVVTGWLLIATGRQALLEAASEPVAESAMTDESPAGMTDHRQVPVPGWMDCFAAGDSYLALLYGSLAGLITAMLWVRLQGTLTWDELQSAAGRVGARQMLPALVILWLAWSVVGR